MSESDPPGQIPIEYVTPQTRCLCFGRYPTDPSPLPSHSRPPLPSPDGANADRSHSVWVAWSVYDNDQVRREVSLRDYFLVSLNRLAVHFTGSDLVHCQLVFWDAQRKQFYTYGVTAENPVHVWCTKTFSRSWKFIRLSVTEDQELTMQNFLTQQLNKPLNLAGQLSLVFRGVPGGGQSWFCSELTAAALERAGLLNFAEWDGFERPCDVAPGYLYQYFTEFCTTCPREVLHGNPVKIVNVLNKRRAAKTPIPLQFGTGTLPQAVADFSENSASSSSTGAPARRMYYERNVPVTVAENSESAAPPEQQVRSPTMLDIFTVAPRKKH